MAASKVIILTGANRGIGRAICESILSHPAAAASTLYATSRAGGDLGYPKLTSRQQILYRPLDITSHASINKLVDEVEEAGNPIDVLINNGGVNLDHRHSYESAQAALDVNCRGTLRMCQALIPFVRPDGGRIVNLSSVASSLKPFSKELQHKFRSITTLEELESLIKDYGDAVKSGNEAKAGFPAQRSYSVSKACINAFTRILANNNDGVLINSCCPGWVNTDMGNQIGKPPKTPEEGAKIPVRLALGDINNISGKYWANDSIRSREDGKPQDW